MFGYQERPGGIAEALGLAERFVDRGQCVVMLADNVFERSLGRDGRALSPPAVRRAASCSPGRTIREHLRHLGVPELDGDGKLVRVVEKPADPPSPYAVTGVYFYDGAVWDVLPTLEPSGRGELEISDVNNWYVERGAMEHEVLEGFWGDAGESIDAYYAVNDFVRHNGANRT